MLMSPKELSKLLKNFHLPARVEKKRTLQSAVTTAWGVDWDEDYIARDLMQNFFDANRQSLSEVQVRSVGPDVLVTGPTPFPLERLFYLGSEKGDDDVGQYGEGFKVAATCLLRDHRVTPIAACGQDVVVLRIGTEAVANTAMCPIEYDFYRIEQAISGSVLLLAGCSSTLTSAMQRGLSHFYHDENPLLGPLLWTDYNHDFQIYQSADHSGHVFYRNLKRGEIAKIPLVLVIHKAYQLIERKIGKDRDRNAFGEEMMALFYNHFAKYGTPYENASQEAVVNAARGVWESGHPLLSEIARFSKYPWSAETSKKIFGDGFYARSGQMRDEALQLEVNRMERAWQTSGRHPLPSYFQEFGVINAESEIRRIREQAADESKRKNQRPPTAAESDAIRLLTQILRDLAPEIVAIFHRGTTHYTVAMTEVVLGQLKTDRGYHSRNVFLAESVFESDFATALAVFLHEHAHIFGYDGSRGFSDALTELLETVIRERRDLDEAETQWERIQKTICRERKRRKPRDNHDGMDAWLELMNDSELRTLMKRIPSAVLKRLRKSNDSEDD